MTSRKRQKCSKTWLPRAILNVCFRPEFVASLASDWSLLPSKMLPHVGPFFSVSYRRTAEVPLLVASFILQGSRGCLSALFLTQALHWGSSIRCPCCSAKRHSELRAPDAPQKDRFCRNPRILSLRIMNFQKLREQKKGKFIFLCFPKIGRRRTNSDDIQKIKPLLFLQYDSV